MSMPNSFAALALVLLSACSPDADSPRGVAEGFLDEHYVRMNLQAAAPYCTGLALHKVEDEIRLLEGQEIDAATLKPSVTYELEEEHANGDDRTTLLYSGDVRLSAGDKFAMRWMLNLRREKGDWKVSNFKEMR